MAELRRVAGVGFDGSTISTSLGKVEIPLIKASYGDKIEAAFASYMGSQTLDEQSPGSYSTDELKMTMTALIYRTVFWPAMPKEGGSLVRIPFVIGRIHPDLGDDFDTLENCRFIAASVAIENTNKVEEVELTFTVQQIKWTSQGKTINQLLRAGQVPAGAVTSGF